jgi:hypothetical protein
MKATHRKSTSKLTADPLEIPPAIPTQQITPETIRLPKPGKLCPYTGMTRGRLNALVLPSKDNNYKPPVKSFSLREKGHQRGVRLIDYQSLIGHIRKFVEKSHSAMA